jgi:hypothetical protein
MGIELNHVCAALTKRSALMIYVCQTFTAKSANLGLFLLYLRVYYHSGLTDRTFRQETQA